MKKVLFSLMAFVFAFAVNAQETEAKEAAEGQANESIAALRLAADLVKYGNAKQQALPLIEALEIISENDAAILDADKEGDAVVEDNAGKSGFVSINFDEVLAQAKKYADGDANLLAIINNIEKSVAGQHRGAVNGPRYKVTSVNANSTDRYVISFYAGQRAEVGVSGDGDTDLDLYVYDSNGNLIGSDTDYTDDCYVSWTPRWTGSFTIKVVNRGRVYNRYVLVTN